MVDEAHLARLDDIYYRMVFAAQVSHALDPARAPEGRSHYDGQHALYLSATSEGTVVAVRRYMAQDDPPRVILPLHVRADRIVDLRDPAATAHFGIDVSHRAIEWQKVRAEGLRSPTWDISDRVRDLGLDGMLYASRSDPSKTHLTLFRWNMAGAASVDVAGPAMDWSG